MTLSRLFGALGRPGYTAHPLEAAAIDSVTSASRHGASSVWSAGLGMMQAMMYAVALYAGAFEGMDPLTRDFFRWLGFPSPRSKALFRAQPFFAGARRELAARRLAWTCRSLCHRPGLRRQPGRGPGGGGQVYLTRRHVHLLPAWRPLPRMRARATAPPTWWTPGAPATGTGPAAHGNGAEETVGVHELVPDDVVQVADGATVPPTASC